MEKISHLDKSSKTLFNRFNMEITDSLETWNSLSEKYNVHFSEITQIDLNRSGIHLKNNEVREGFRVRFKGNLFEDNESWFALPVRRNEDTNFNNISQRVYLNETEIGFAKDLMLDTCESSYQRGPNLLNLNSRSRSNCSGCKACVHNYKDLYDNTVIKDNVELQTPEDIENFFDKQKIDVPNLKQIAVVTGLFGSEEKVVEHMKIVNDVAKKRDFNGELMYFGCEINSKTALNELSKIDNFSIVYALDNFTKRDQILSKVKSKITLDVAKETLGNAKSLGIRTNMAYISGIDPINDMIEGFTKIKDSLSSFPVVNVYQIQTLEQSKILDESARNLDYFVKSRIELENIFIDTTMRPKRWENYRPLWYQYFANEKLANNSYGENE